MIIGQHVQTKYGTCLVKSQTEMEVIDSNDPSMPNGTIIESKMPEIVQEKYTPKTPKTPKIKAEKPVKSVAEELAEDEAKLKALQNQLVSIG